MAATLAERLEEEQRTEAFGAAPVAAVAEERARQNDDRVATVDELLAAATPREEIVLIEDLGLRVRIGTFALDDLMKVEAITDPLEQSLSVIASALREPVMTTDQVRQLANARPAAFAELALAAMRLNGLGKGVVEAAQRRFPGIAGPAV